jgi:hypothetical protein
VRASAVFEEALISSTKNTSGLTVKYALDKLKKLVYPNQEKHYILHTFFAQLLSGMAGFRTSPALYWSRERPI